MRLKASAAILLTIALGFTGCGVMDAGNEPIRAPYSYKALRYKETVRQLLDFSCGAASLATILTYFFDRKTSELEVLAIVRSRYPTDAEWKKKEGAGLSFDDMIFASEVLGYKAAGVKISVSELKNISGPVIVHLKRNDLEHFSVLRKFDGQTAYLSDPILGLVGLHVGRFEAEFQGHALGVWREGEPLPFAAPLATIRDGLSVSNAIRPVLRQGQPVYTRTN